jgi:hypothetical protein
MPAPVAPKQDSSKHTKTATITTTTQKSSRFTSALKLPRPHCVHTMPFEEAVPGGHRTQMDAPPEGLLGTYAGTAHGMQAWRVVPLR